MPSIRRIIARNPSCQILAPLGIRRLLAPKYNVPLPVGKEWLKGCLF